MRWSAEGARRSFASRLDRSDVALRAGAAREPGGRLEHPLLKFVVYSLVPTVPVFRLHQFITYGGAFGEYYTFGLKAYLLGVRALVGVVAPGPRDLAAVFRAVVEVVALAVAAWCRRTPVARDAASSHPAPALLRGDADLALLRFTAAAP